MILLFCKYSPRNMPLQPASAFGGIDVRRLFVKEMNVTLPRNVLMFPMNTDMLGHSGILLLSRSTACVIFELYAMIFLCV